jgi:hypothetical protein
MVAALLLLVFLLLAGAMISGRLPALLALPLLALGVGLVAGVPYYYARAGELAPGVNPLWVAGTSTLDMLAREVCAKGVGRLHKAVFAVFLGGIFGKLLDVTGVASTLVRRVAELAGDRTFELTLALTLTVSFLFSGLGGLGAVIMVANVVFPVLLSLGVPPLSVACIFLMGFSLGGVFNLVNWALYIDVLGMTQGQVAGFALPFGGIYLVVLLVFLVRELRAAHLQVPMASLGKAVGCLFLGLGGGWGAWQAGWLQGGPTVWGRLPFLSLLVLSLLIPRDARKPGILALLSPGVPIGLVLFLGLPVPAAFCGGIVFLLLKAPGSGRDQHLSKAMIEGVRSVAPAICLMMGIGMVLVATWHPAVSEVLRPLVVSWVPRSPGRFVLFFAVLAPLALYRGPLNLWGMGFGLAGLLHRSGALTPRQILVAFLSDGQLQGVCDPTNTHNVWIANQLGVELQDILKRTLPPIWGLAVLGLLLGAYGI